MPLIRSFLPAAPVYCAPASRLLACLRVGRRGQPAATMRTKPLDRAGTRWQDCFKQFLLHARGECPPGWTGERLGKWTLTVSLIAPIRVLQGETSYTPRTKARTNPSSRWCSAPCEAAGLTY